MACPEAKQGGVKGGLIINLHLLSKERKVRMEEGTVAEVGFSVLPALAVAGA